MKIANVNYFHIGTRYERYAVVQISNSLKPSGEYLKKKKNKIKL